MLFCLLLFLTVGGDGKEGGIEVVIACIFVCLFGKGGGERVWWNVKG